MNWDLSILFLKFSGDLNINKFVVEQVYILLSINQKGYSQVIVFKWLMSFIKGVSVWNDLPGILGIPNDRTPDYQKFSSRNMLTQSNQQQGQTKSKNCLFCLICWGLSTQKKHDDKVRHAS